MRLLGVGKDVQSPAKKSRAEIESDLRRIQKRGRVEEAIREMESRRAKIAKDLERTVVQTAETVLKRLHAPIHGELASLSQRMAEVERRLDAIEARAQSGGQAA